MGPLWSKSVDMGSLVRVEDGMGSVVGLTLDFRLMLPVVTYDQGRSGKMDCFGGMCCCLGGLMGPPGPRVLIWGPWLGMGMGWGGWVV